MSEAFAAAPALLIVDLQGGTLGRTFAPISAEACLTAALGPAMAVRAAGGMVIAARSVFAADLADVPRGDVDRPMPVLATGLPDSWDALPDPLAGIADLIVDRPHWNAFHGTGLDIALRRRDVGDLIIAGVTTSFAIESTARHGWELGYSQWFAADAMASITEESHFFALANVLPRLGRVRDCAGLTRLLATI